MMPVSKGKTMDNLKPMEIEAKSFEIITSEMPKTDVSPDELLVLKRVIHTSADFDYCENLYFSQDVIEIIKAAIKNGCDIVTDTQMVKAGINKTISAQLSCNVHCFIADEDVAATAQELGKTRSYISMEKAADLDRPCIFAIGNAPTALTSIYNLVKNNKLKPIAIIAVPVGFVNVVESKELILNSDIPCIVAKGRKGGSNVAAAICNAILYQIKR